MSNHMPNVNSIFATISVPIIIVYKLEGDITLHQFNFFTFTLSWNYMSTRPEFRKQFHGTSYTWNHDIRFLSYRRIEPYVEWNHINVNEALHGTDHVNYIPPGTPCWEFPPPPNTKTHFVLE